jgi:peroxin-1
VKIVKDPSKFPKNVYPSIEINDKLRNLLDLNSFEKISLKPQIRCVNLVEKIDLIPGTKLLPNVRKDIEDKFKEHIIKNSKMYPVLLNQNQVFKILDYYFTVKLEPDDLKYCLVNAKLLKENKILCIDSNKSVDNVVNIEENVPSADLKKGIQIEKFDDIEKECVDRLKLKLCLDERNKCRKLENILISGE